MIADIAREVLPVTVAIGQRQIFHPPGLVDGSILGAAIDQGKEWIIIRVDRGAGGGLSLWLRRGFGFGLSAHRLESALLRSGLFLGSSCCDPSKLSETCYFNRASKGRSPVLARSRIALDLPRHPKQRLGLRPVLPCVAFQNLGQHRQSMGQT